MNPAAWHLRDLAVAGAGLTFLAAQVAICLVQLGEPRPARFGWQMYSGLKNPVQWFVVARSGEQRRISIDRYIAFPRYELDDVESKAVPLICRDYPEAEAVRFTYVAKGDRAVPCNGAPEPRQPK